MRRQNRRRKKRDHYLIEFRFFGRAKHNMKGLIYEVDQRFHLRQTKRHRPVPHISIIAPFSTNNSRRLISDFHEICSTYPIMDFKVEGYGCFKEARVVYINIIPSKELKEFRLMLFNKLEDYCRLNPTDINKSWSPHATIAKKIPYNKFEQIKRYIAYKEKPNYRHSLIRVTLIKNNRILREYDFVLNRMLSRQEAKDKQILSETFSNISEHSTKPNQSWLGLLSKITELLENIFEFPKENMK